MEFPIDPGKADDYNDHDEFAKAAENANVVLLAQFTRYLVSEKKLPLLQANTHETDLKFFGSAFLAGYEGVGLIKGYDLVGPMNTMPLVTVRKR